ncbi:MAG: NADH-quinone oxidoreductase subunit N [Candidatus Eisenbacteria bacterium]
MRSEMELALLPWMVLAGLAVALMGATALYRRRGLALGLTLFGLALAGAALIPAAGRAPVSVTTLLRVDGFALFFLGLVIGSTAVVVLLSGRYVRHVEERAEEYYILLVLSALGAGTLVAATHFASFFLGLELLSVSLYGLIAYPCARPQAIEAGIKYLVLAAVSSAFLLFGMALVYARLGTLEFDAIARLLAGHGSVAGGGIGDLALQAGFGLMLVGFGFKLGLVPFHMWTPDVYQGAPAPVTAFVATVSKGAVMAVLVRFGAALHLAPSSLLGGIIALIAGASMFAGNLLALRQTNLKRLLAYSSIAHLGYVLVAFLAGGAAAVEAVAFYLVAYVLTSLVAFGVITVLSDGRGREWDREELAEYRGLGRRRPVLAGILALALFSLAGIPLTAGFIGKFLVFTSGIGSAQWALVFAVAVNSGIGIYYYLRVIVALYLRDDEPATESSPEGGESQGPIYRPAGIALAVLAALLLLLGVLPQLVLRIIALPG